MTGNGEGIGSLIGGRYRLSNEIGSGSHGRVWAARDELLRRTVALRRVYWPDSPDHDEVRSQALLRLNRTLSAQRGDPGILSVLDVLSGIDGMWVVTDYAPGTRTLADVLQESGPLSIDRVAGIGFNLLLVIARMHHAGVVFGNLTPDRVLVTPEGFIQLVGFDEDMLRQSVPRWLSSTGAVQAVRFSAPEIISGRPLTPAADLYSLGAVLYEAVQGAGPFGADGDQDAFRVLNAVLHEEPTTPSRAGALGPVLLRMLAKNVSERPAPDEVLAAFEMARTHRRTGVVAAQPNGVTGGVSAATKGSLTSTPFFVAGRWNSGWAWTGLVIVSLATALLAVLVGRVLPLLDNMWWLAGLWVLLVSAAVANALRRPMTSEPSGTTTLPSDPRTAPRRGMALLSGATDSALFLRSRAAVPPLPPSRDAYLHQAYNRLGPPPSAARTRQSGGSA